MIQVRMTFGCLPLSIADTILALLPVSVIPRVPFSQQVCKAGDGWRGPEDWL
jgi:hypothetical protein